MASRRNSNLDHDKDWILVSIHDKLDEIAKIFEGVADKTANLPEIRALKDHSSDLLKHICDKNKGDSNYLIVPKTSAVLFDDREAMLSRVDEDVVHMRGYLKGKPRDTHVANFRSLRSHVKTVLAAVTKAHCSGDIKMLTGDPATLLPPPFNKDEVEEAPIRRKVCHMKTVKSEPEGDDISNLFANTKTLVPDTPTTSSTAKLIPRIPKQMQRAAQKTTIPKYNRQIWIFSTREDAALPPSDYQGLQTPSLMFFEHIFFPQSSTFLELLSKKRHSCKSWGTHNTIVFDPTIEGSYKEFANQRFHQKIIYFDAFIQSRVDEGDGNAIEISKMKPSQQWAALGVWGSWIHGRGIQMPPNWFDKQRALKMGVLVGAKEEYMKELREYEVVAPRCSHEKKKEKFYRAKKIGRN